ncbi:MAG: helix-turn-helix domain-containing protein [Anaerostipes sp.]|uniref:helix-turn-helix domain-containing protein n=1 Tax=Anaerostipes sp. TaxID=1872530 RepID=UPI0039967898
MNIGNQISNIRKKQQLTQEEFGRLFHVTRQTVSNWENEKSYPDLQILVDMSNQFEISLDTLLKEDSKMVNAIDKERVLGTIKHEKSIIDFFTGAGTGIVASCLFSPDSTIRTVAIIVGLVMIGIGWYKKAKCDKKAFKYMEEHEEV